MDQEYWTTASIERRYVVELRKLGWSVNQVVAEWLGNKKGRRASKLEVMASQGMTVGQIGTINLESPELPDLGDL